MILYVIYRPTTSDLPGCWVVRKHHILPGLSEGVPEPEPFALAASLEEARAALPQGLALVARDPDDDPVIEETWI